MSVSNGAGGEGVTTQAARLQLQLEPPAINLSLERLQKMEDALNRGAAAPLELIITFNVLTPASTATCAISNCHGTGLKLKTH